MIEWAGWRWSFLDLPVWVLAIVWVPALWHLFAGSRRTSATTQVPWWATQIALTLAVLLLATPPERRTASASTTLWTSVDSSSSAQPDAGLITPFVLRDLSVRSERPGSAVSQFVGNLNDVDQIRGSGLSAREWYEAVDRGPIQAELDVTTGYIREVTLPREIVAGVARQFAVVLREIPPGSELTIQSQRTDQVSVSLEPDLPTVSVTLPPLPAAPVALQVSLSQADKILDSVTVGVDIVSPPTARMLFLQAAPSFEWRALMHWAERTGTDTAIRTQISDDRYSQRFINASPRDLSMIDSGLLRDIDLVMIDGAFLRSLDEAQRSALLNRDAGHGVVVLLHDMDDLVAATNASIGEFESTSDSVIYQVDQSAEYLDSGLTRLDVELLPSQWQPLLTQLDGRVVIARSRENDNLAVSLVRDSYRLTGAAGVAAFGHLWADVVSQMARPLRDEHLESFPERPLIHERLQICQVSGRTQSMSVVTPSRSIIELDWVDTPLRPGEQCVWFWPDEAGWYQIGSANRVINRYIGEDDNWSTQRAEHAVAITSALLGSQSSRRDNTADNWRAIQRTTLLPWVLAAWLIGWLLQRLILSHNRRPKSI